LTTKGVRNEGVGFFIEERILESSDRGAAQERTVAGGILSAQRGIEIVTEKLGIHIESREESSGDIASGDTRGRGEGAYADRVSEWSGASFFRKT
jgi:hypothetical protein